MAAENYVNDTIAAISTPPGAGGIGVIRMSGPHSLDVLRQIFRPGDPACPFNSHQFYYGHIFDPGHDPGPCGPAAAVDEVLAVYMRAPRTYTREEVVEIHAHGNALILQSILELLLRCQVRLAEPGEFTKRAFLNGRIDLTRAEAVIDVLAARTRKGMEMAQAQLAGRLYDEVETIRQALISMRAVVEVAIDFPDEDVEIIDHGRLGEQLARKVRAPLAVLLRHADQGRIVREGVNVVIAGLPNVGKSSLLNTLLQEERALVTAIPGTTRDTIEELIDVKGIPMRIVDTAGIRDNVGGVEELGIRRARRQMEQADLVLFLVDLEAGVSDADRRLFAGIQHKPVIMVANKIDLRPERLPELTEFEGRSLARVGISAQKQMGIEALKQAIFAAVTGGKGQWEEEGCAPNLRHKQALIRASAASERVLNGLRMQATCDLLAVDLQECLGELDAILGVTTTEDILDSIFQQFCLGK